MKVVRRSAGPTKVTPEGNRQWFGHGERMSLMVAEFTGGPKSEPNPPHAHPHEQIGYVVDGEIIMFIGDEQAKVGPGDFWVIPGGVRHTVQLLTKTARLVECFSPVREDFPKG